MRWLAWVTLFYSVALVGASLWIGIRWPDQMSLHLQIMVGTAFLIGIGAAVALVKGE